MSKRYVYTYTPQELQRRRWIAVVIGLPAWALISFVIVSGLIHDTIISLIASIVAAALLTALTWLFNTRQLNKFTESD